MSATLAWRRGVHLRDRHRRLRAGPISETTTVIPGTEAPFRSERLALLSALVDDDASFAFRIAAKLLVEGVSFEQLMTDVVAPVQHELGRRWAMNDLGIADEHAASAAV